MHDDKSRDDRTLAEAALRDRNAYVGIVGRYERPLLRYVKRLLGSYAQSAEDVLQDVFIKAYVNLNDYDLSRPFAPWIYRIAHNEAVTFLRKRQTQPQVIEGADALVLLERVTDESDMNESADVVRTESRIHAAMATLDQRYRDVLVLRYLEEKSYDDIADILRLPPGTVATRIRRGLRQLKSSLKSPAGDGGRND